MRVLGSKNMLETMAPCRTRVIRGSFSVGPHIVGDGENVLDVGAVELIHGQDVTAYKFQKCPPEAVGM